MGTKTMLRAGAWLLVALVHLELLYGVATARAQQAAAPTEVGTIAGVVLDGATGDPIIEAGIEVIGQGKKVRTDLDGKYSIKVPPGTYELRLFAPLYQGTRLQNVTVRANQVTKADANLKPEGEAAVEVVEVVAQASKAAESTQLIQRQKADTVQDSIGAQEIATTPDSDAAEVVERLPAVTVVDNQFIYVRGLGERYSNAQLNGSHIPSTDPERRVVALDLFPAAFVESISVIKTFAPDLPGDFSGGLVDIRLVDFPEKFSYSIGVNTGANTAATFQDFDDYNHSSTPFGVNPPQPLPGIFPNKLPENLPPAQQRYYASSLENIWSVEGETAPPNFGLNFSISDTIGPLGFGIAGLYSTERNIYEREIAAVLNRTGGPGEASVGDNFVYKHSFFDAKVAGILNLGYKISPNDKIALRSLVNLLEDSEVLNGDGFLQDDSTRRIFQTELTYEREKLGFFQLAGEHRLPSLEDTLLEWRTAGAQSTDDLPDTRLYQYEQPVDNPSTPTFRFAPGQRQPARAYQNLDEYLTDSNIDVTFPFKTAGNPASLKAGAEYLFRTRTSQLRTFEYRAIDQGPSDLTAPPEVILQPSNIGNTVDFRETTQNTYGFRASQEVIAGYAMVETPLIAEQARLIAGVRTEYSFIDLIKAFNNAQQPISPKILDIDPLPAVTAIYEPRTDMRLSAAYGQSVSRPDMRELDPAEFPVALGERSVEGNPNLVTAHIQSYDLRWDWFFAPLELASASFFYKQLDKPIEQVTQLKTSSVVDTFRNAADATVYGIELEGRKNFGFLASLLHDRQFSTVTVPFFNNLRVLANLSWLTSDVNVGRGVLETQTSLSRELQGASPLVINASLEYENERFGTFRLLYNSVDRYLASVGINTLPDIFQEQRNQLDFAWLSKITPFEVPLNTKFAVENILNDPYTQTEGGTVVSNYSTGVKFTASLNYTF